MSPVRRDQLVVTAALPGGGTGLFLVDGDASGLDRTGYATYDGGRAARVVLADTPSYLAVCTPCLFSMPMIRRSTSGHRPRRTTRCWASPSSPSERLAGRRWSQPTTHPAAARAR